MSTDSEIDEDELLQQALIEQSQRDLNYQKAPPKSSKPIPNYVQPPKHSPNPNPNPNSPIPDLSSQNRNRNRSMDDDEDSEVEMLSISSGDEDSSKTSANTGSGGGGGGGGGGNRRNRPGRASKEDLDANWDGGEPNCWKRVSEAELARRVREMREMRAVHVAPKTERKTSVTGKKLTSLQSFPRGMECIDPLGIGIIDNRTLRLITESSDSSPSKEKENINTLREKLAFFSENFDAKLFLSRIHQETSAADLEDGAKSIKTDLQGRTQQRKTLVKENFDCFVSCKTTIDDIESKLKKIEEDPEGAGTLHLQRCIKGVSQQASRAFGSLFERQAQAEKIRAVQGMLQRFRTLFNLPSTIRTSISNGEYDLAVREYRKAKSIALPSHIKILKRVWEEVDRLMQEFKGNLYRSMEDPRIDLADLENTVRLLFELEPESDPVWHFLNLQNQRIRGLLEKCSFDHEARLEALQNEIRDRAVSDAKWIQILQPDGNGNLDTGLDPQCVELSADQVDGLRRKYIYKLTAVLIHHIPIFWKIAVSVFSGKFAKSSQVSADSNHTASNKIDDKMGDGRYLNHSLDEVSGMMRSTISLYEVKVLTAFREFEESNILQTYMSDSIKEISKACKALEVKDSASPVIVTALRSIHVEVSKIYIVRLCSWMRSTIEDLSRDETWVPVSIIERNKSPYTISFLPLAFRSIIISAIDQVHQMIQMLKNEAARTEGVFVPFQEIQESVRLSFLNCFLDFSGHLERIGTELSQGSSGSPHLSNGHFIDPAKRSFDLSLGSIVDQHQQLLMVLSNIGYCKDELCYELYDKYKHVWSLCLNGKDEEDADKVDLTSAFSALENKVLEQYTYAKANSVRSAAMNYLLDAGVQWGAAPSVKGVRDAAVELLHTLVAVHAEVFAGAKPLLGKTLGILVEGLIDTLLSIFEESKDNELRFLDANGFCQLMLELEYFETVLNPYFTNAARESLKSLQGALLEKATESMAEVAADDKQQGTNVSPDDLIALAQQCSCEILGAELERTRLNTACFAESIPTESVPTEPAKTASYASVGGAVDSPTKIPTKKEKSSSSGGINLFPFRIR